MTLRLVLLALLAILAQVSTAALALEFTYELAPGDEVRVTVFREPDMSGQFRIDDSGVLSVPGVGDVIAAGRTVGDLRKALMQALAGKHLANPDVVVQVIQYAPVFVMGDVRNPGQYNVTPGMTVLQLIAIAGGFTPIASSDSTHLLGEQSRYREELMVARERFAALAVRRARLLAERDAQRDFEVPHWLESQIGRARLDQIFAAERSLLRIRIDEPATRSKLLHEQRSEIDNETEALSAQLASARELKTIVDVELKAFRQHLQRGIINNVRVMELERLALDTDLRINSAVATISRTKQDRTSVNLQLQKIDEEMRVKTAESLADTETEMAVLNRRIAAAVEFLSLSGGEAPMEQIGQSNLDRTFIIARGGRDHAEVVTGGAAVRAGDILTVMRQVSSVRASSASTNPTPPISQNAELTGARK
ncbi:MAG TPA: polysaccharide biosynthesis/export family protein [Vicinamibacterales bacterium]|jgi:polysaccharide export outer membrane protein